MSGIKTGYWLTRSASFFLGVFFLGALVYPSIGIASEVAKSNALMSMFDQTKARLFVIRDGEKFDLNGVSLRLKGKQIAVLNHMQWNLVEYPTGEVSWEVGSIGRYDCKGRVVIDPLKDNFLLIKDRDPADVRRDYQEKSTFRDFLFGNPESRWRGDCGGLWELIKISESDATKRLSEFKYQPHKNDRSGFYSKESICRDLSMDSCEVSFEMVRKVRQAFYQIDSSIPVSVKPTELQVGCKVGSNPLLTLGVEACIKIKGQILGKENLKCVLANNPPIPLDPELCLSGGGFVVQ